MPTLYSVAKTGKIVTVLYYTVQELDGSVSIVNIHGQLDGLKITDKTNIKTGKNIGRVNETSVIDQANSEMESKWKSKLDKNYTTNSNGIPDTTEKSLLPMLAQKFNEKKHKITYPCIVQRKLNGCLFRTSKLITEDGIKTIEDIVENKLQLKVLSYNVKTNKNEFKKIINWYNNGVEIYNNWLEIVPEYGMPLRCTKDHIIYTNNGEKAANTLNPTLDKIVVSNKTNKLTSYLLGTLFGDSIFIIETRGSETSYRLSFSHSNKEYFDFKVETLNLPGKVVEYTTEYGSQAWRFTSTALTNSGLPIEEFYYVGKKDPKNLHLLGQRKLVSYKTLRKYLTLESLSFWIADAGSIRLNNGNKDTPIISLATHGHSKEQVDEFIKYFTTVFGRTPTKIHERQVNITQKVGGIGLLFNTKDSLFILNKLKNYGCRGVEYKYYFPITKYIDSLKNIDEYSSFHIRHSKSMPAAIKYDIEVEDNHNYFADNVLVHNCRALVKKRGGQIEVTSRTNKPYTTVSHLFPEVTKLLETLPENTILDGEIYNHDLSLQEINRRLKKYRPGETENLQYHIYDIADETTTNVKRDAILQGLQSSKKVSIEESFIANSEKEIKEFHDKFVKEGYEGVIIRNLNGLYLFDKRSDDLQKYKEFIDDEFEIVNVTSGDGREAGAIIYICKVKSPLNNHTGEFAVRPKGTIEDRIELMKNSKKLIGKKLIVRYQELTEDGIPSFPIGIAVRLDQDLPK